MARWCTILYGVLPFLAIIVLTAGRLSFTPSCSTSSPLNVGYKETVQLKGTGFSPYNKKGVRWYLQRPDRRLTIADCIPGFRFFCQCQLRGQHYTITGTRSEVTLTIKAWEGTVGEDVGNYTLHLLELPYGETIDCPMILVDDTKECDSGPCRNGATCLDDYGSYSCACARGFAGQACETATGACRNAPCPEGATCVDGGDSYTCNCPPGLTGATCDTDIADTSACSSAPCRQGATCVEGGDSYTCNCPPGLTGATCDTAVGIDGCASSPCDPGGSCQNNGGNYICTCSPGFQGTRCETASRPGNPPPTSTTTGVPPEKEKKEVTEKAAATVAVLGSGALALAAGLAGFTVFLLRRRRRQSEQVLALRPPIDFSASPARDADLEPQPQDVPPSAASSAGGAQPDGAEGEEGDEENASDDEEAS
ncbi:hypothetical protein BaRGS_00014041 [Batillaria attramentaria]|uniref:EGF-like domain-containing protein n=1 Tax=Batillaria attramentaria TaxID=370345 RepID=A0ABD0L5Z3_9CAEN